MFLLEMCLEKGSYFLVVAVTGPKCLRPSPSTETHFLVQTLSSPHIVRDLQTFFSSLLQTLLKSSTLRVCQRVCVVLSFYFSISFFYRPKLWGSRSGGKAENGNFCVCMSRFFGSRCIFTLMLRVTNYLSMGTVWFVECASTLSLMWTLWFFFVCSFSINNESDSFAGWGENKLATMRKCETRWNVTLDFLDFFFYFTCGRVYCFF